MTTAIVIGDSYTECIARALDCEPEWRDQIRVYRLSNKRSKTGDGHISIDDAKSIINTAEHSTSIYISVSGTYHNILELLRHEKDYSIILDNDYIIKEDEISEIIPVRALWSAFDSHIMDSEYIIELCKIARGRLNLLSPPPPKESNQYIFDKLSGMKKKSYRGQLVADVGINPPALRYALWKIECARLQRWCGHYDVAYVPPPAKAFDGAMFLKECYYSEDATHANRAYGALVIEQILQHSSRWLEGSHG
jgi:hypothetical protein